MSVTDAQADVCACGHRQSEHKGQLSVCMTCGCHLVSSTELAEAIAAAEAVDAWAASVVDAPPLGVAEQLDVARRAAAAEASE